MYPICVRNPICKQWVAVTADNLAALATAETIATKSEKPDEASPISTTAC